MPVRDTPVLPGLGCPGPMKVCIVHPGRAGPEPAAHTRFMQTLEVIMACRRERGVGGRGERERERERERVVLLVEERIHFSHSFLLC